MAVKPTATIAPPPKMAVSASRRSSSFIALLHRCRRSLFWHFVHSIARVHHVQLRHAMSVLGAVLLALAGVAIMAFGIFLFYAWLPFFYGLFGLEIVCFWTNG